MNFHAKSQVSNSKHGKVMFQREYFGEEGGRGLYQVWMITANK